MKPFLGPPPYATRAQPKLLGNKRQKLDTFLGRFLTRFKIPEVESELVRLLCEELAEDLLSSLEDSETIL